MVGHRRLCLTDRVYMLFLGEELGGHSGQECIATIMKVSRPCLACACWRSRFLNRGSPVTCGTALRTTTPLLCLCVVVIILVLRLQACCDDCNQLSCAALEEIDDHLDKLPGNTVSDVLRDHGPSREQLRKEFEQAGKAAHMRL